MSNWPQKCQELPFTLYSQSLLLSVSPSQQSCFKSLFIELTMGNVSWNPRITLGSVTRDECCVEDNDKKLSLLFALGYRNSNLVSAALLQGRICCFYHFRREETEAQRDRRMPELYGWWRWSQYLCPGSVTPEHVFLTALACFTKGLFHIYPICLCSRWSLVASKPPGENPSSESDLSRLPGHFRPL